MGLDHEHTRTALSIAGSKSAGLRCNFGTMTKPYHSGAAAQNGVVAAKLASMGYSADPSGWTARGASSRWRAAAWTRNTCSASWAARGRCLTPAYP